MRPDITRSMYVSLEKQSNIDFLKNDLLNFIVLLPYIGNSVNEIVERVLSYLCSANKGLHLRSYPKDTLKGKINV